MRQLIAYIQRKQREWQVSALTRRTKRDMNRLVREQWRL